MGKTIKGKDKAKVKAAKAAAKVARKCKGKKCAVAVAALALAAIFAGCATSDSAQPAKSQTQNNTYGDDKIKDIRTKLYTETQLSLDMTDKLFEEFHKLDFAYDADNISFCIHIDAGNGGPSGQVIPEVVGYVHSMGYDCEVKPDSPIASCIADRISK